LRVIAGSLKGRRLQGPPPADVAVRPTSDRAREALFSILEPRPRGPFLELFAGTGAVGIEAFSRGHLPVVCVESAPSALKLLRINTAGTPVRIVPTDALRLKADAFHGLGLVFADPPYRESAQFLNSLANRILGWLSPEGCLVWECSAAVKIEVPDGYRLLDLRTYGSATFHFLGR
jgi:16S rRNA (guanine966-N2)-methyltransferase